MWFIRDIPFSNFISEQIFHEPLLFSLIMKYYLLLIQLFKIKYSYILLNVLTVLSLDVGILSFNKGLFSKDYKVKFIQIVCCFQLYIFTNLYSSYFGEGFEGQ